MSIKVSLTVTEGVDKGLTRELTGPLLIGRAASDFPLNDKKVSGKHCNFFIEGHQVFLEDLGSTNGTFVNGRRIEDKVELKNLDEIIVGLSRMTIAIMDNMADFKKKNAPTPAPAKEKVREEATKTKAAVEAPREAEILELEPLDDSGEIEELQPIDLDLQPDEPPTKVSQSVSVSATPSAEDLPPADAVYRETGIQRIENLISDELDTFSKWDHPGGEERTERSSGLVPKIKIRLTLRRGPEGSQNAVCTNAITTMGRKDVDIRLNDLDCSRRHAQVEIVAGSQAFLRDLASTNGSYVNGKRVAYQELKTGDLIQVGQTIFEVSIDTGK